MNEIRAYLIGMVEDVLLLPANDIVAGGVEYAIDWVADVVCADDAGYRV